MNKEELKKESEVEEKKKQGKEGAGNKREENIKDRGGSNCRH